MRRTSFFGFLVGLATMFAGCDKPRPPDSSSDMMRSMMRGGSNGMMGGPNGMMNVSQRDMGIYMEMFERHREIRRTVTQLSNGIRTVTESDNPNIVKLLHEHVPSMYRHLAEGDEVRCMSDSLPTMFRNAARYKRRFELTKRGVAVTETSDDTLVLAAIRRHADEVSGFVREGMSAMMRGMTR